MMPCYNYSEEQISWYLHRVDPRPGVLIFTRKNFTNKTDRSRGHI